MVNKDLAAQDDVINNIPYFPSLLQQPCTGVLQSLWWQLLFFHVVTPSYTNDGTAVLVIRTLFYLSWWIDCFKALMPVIVPALRANISQNLLISPLCAVVGLLPSVSMCEHVCVPGGGLFLKWWKVLYHISSSLAEIYLSVRLLLVYSNP